MIRFVRALVSMAFSESFIARIVQAFVCSKSGRFSFRLRCFIDSDQWASRSLMWRCIALVTILFRVSLIDAVFGVLITCCVISFGRYLCMLPFSATSGDKAEG